MRRHAPGLGCAIALVLASATSTAYVRQVTSKSMKPLAWKSGCVFVSPNVSGSKDLGADLALAEIQLATHNWVSQTGNCSYMQFTLDPVSSSLQPGLDGKNAVLWLNDFWGRTVNGMQMEYSPQAPAQTTIIFVDDPASDRDGEILDADTELNGKDFHFGVFNPQSGVCEQGACTTSSCVMDLQNVLTHEFGHMLGLDHTCFDNVPTVRPLDNNGQPIPDCSGAGLPASITDATMYNFADCGETKKQTLSFDDKNAICDIYPVAKDPHACARVTPTGGTGALGCACAVGRPAQGGGGLLLGGLILLTARACSRSRRRSGCGGAACDRPPASGAA